MNEPIQYIEDGTRKRLDEHSVIPNPSQPWHGFPIEFSTYKIPQRNASCFPHFFLIHYKNGGNRTWIKSGNTESYFDTLPGSTILVQSGFEASRLRFTYREEDCVSTTLEINPAKLSSLFQQDAPKLMVNGVQLVQDANIGQLLDLMETEILSDCRTGRAYGESLSLALATYLYEKHALKPIQSQHSRVFSTTAAQKLLTYIEEHLAHDISVADLARLVHLSPFHFGRVFKATFNVAPYRFILERRLQAAHRLLATDISIEEISDLTGFSSQGHLATAFRKRFGSSPTQIRKRRVISLS